MNQLPPRFNALILAQSLGALNDNLFKTLLQLYVLQIVVLAQPETIILPKQHLSLRHPSFCLDRGPATWLIVLTK
jgi:hypothetical protein